MQCICFSHWSPWCARLAYSIPFPRSHSHRRRLKSYTRCHPIHGIPCDTSEWCEPGTRTSPVWRKGEVEGVGKRILTGVYIRGQRGSSYLAGTIFCCRMCDDHSLSGQFQIGERTIRWLSQPFITGNHAEAITAIRNDIITCNNLLETLVGQIFNKIHPFLEIQSDASWLVIRL